MISPDALRLARTFETRMNSMEGVADYDRRQQEARDLFVQTRDSLPEGGVRRLVDLAARSVETSERVTGALRIARITHQALLDGAYGTAPQLAQVALAMLDAVQGPARQDVAPKLLEAVRQSGPDEDSLRVLDMGLALEEQVRPRDSDGDGSARIARLALEAAAGTPPRDGAEVLDLGEEMWFAGHSAAWLTATKLMEPIVDGALEAAPRDGKANLKFAWPLARTMHSRQARGFLDRVLREDWGTGDEARLALLREAQSTNPEGYQAVLASRMGDGNRRAILALARKVDRDLPADPRRGDVVLRLVEQNRPLDGDEAWLDLGRDLFRTGPDMDDPAGRQTSDVGKAARALAAKIQDPGARQAVEMAAGITRKLEWGAHLVLAALEEAREILHGKPFDPVALGRKLIAQDRGSFQSELTHEVLDDLLARPEYAGARDTLAVARKAFGKGVPFEDSVRVADHVMKRVDGGLRDGDLAPLARVREMLGRVSNPETRFRMASRLLEDLTGRLSQPQARQLLALSFDLVGEAVDPAYAGEALEALLDKAGRLEAGESLDLIQDGLEVANRIPDPLSRANLLRGLVNRDAARLTEENKLHYQVRDAIKDVSALGDRSDERLQLQVDLLNLLVRQEKNPQGPYDLQREVLARFPERHRDVAALTIVGWMKTDPTRANVDDLRADLPAGDQAILADVHASLLGSAPFFGSLRKGLEALDHAEYPSTAGAAALLLMDAVADRAHTPEVDKVLADYRKAVDREGRISSSTAQEALNQAVRAILVDTRERTQDPRFKTVLDYMASRWGKDPAANRKLVLETLSDLDRFDDGNLQSLTEWVEEKIFDRPSEHRDRPEIRSGDDYVIIGGMVLPRNKG